MATPEEIERTRAIMRYYRDRHRYQPLPSLVDDRHPSVPYAEFWDRPGPAEWIDDARTTNVQLMCGARWNLIVADLDGLRAVEVWDGWKRTLPIPETWEVQSPSGGRHVWFSCPPGTTAVESRWVWMDGEKHSCVEILADRKLVMAPPSLHVKHGLKPYEFRAGHNPATIRRPAPAPAWLLALPEVRPRATAADIAASRPVAPMTAPPRVGSASYDRSTVLDAIPDKADVARGWGLEITKDTAGDWVPCRAIGRTDMARSASINRRTGVYHDFGSTNVLAFFDLAVALGAYPDWISAKIDLGQRFGAPTVTLT